ncbi:MAG: SiaB family protein kinase [Bacteroidota bacterium]|nr:SiaB family protein kinase [Bacteroidota bacterium]
MKSKHEHNFIFDLIFETAPDDLNYIYRGVFDADITNYILSLAEKNIIESKIKSRTKKRVFHIMVESIQNITRHQDFSDEELADTAFFVIQKNGTFFYITSGNTIAIEDIEPLKEKLENLNNLSKAELTQTYLEILNDGKISSKGGAGLGLIEIVRKSGNKLLYNFKRVSDTKAFIYLHTFIETDPKNSFKTVNKIYTFDYLKNLHSQILKENILLIYSNLFEQNSLVRLINVLKSQRYSALAFKKRIISTMIELLQNIILHGKIKINNKYFSPGVFYISKKNENIFHLNTVNYIENDKKEKLQESIEKLNNSNQQEIEEIYNTQLFDFSENTRNAGLGLIELRLKSKNKLIFNIMRINDKHSLLLLTITLIDNG